MKTEKRGLGTTFQLEAVRTDAETGVILSGYTQRSTIRTQVSITLVVPTLPISPE